MDPKSSLTTTPQPQREVRKTPVFGGFDELVEQGFELIAKGRGDFTTTESSTESYSALSHEPVISSSQEMGSPTSSFGSQTEIRFNSLEEYQYKQTLKRIEELPRQTAQIEQTQDMQQEVRLEIAGLSDEQFADKAGYKNKSFRGPLLRTIHNMWDVFKTLLGEKKASLEEKKSIIVERARGKINHATNKNSAAERGGGQTSVFDTPG